MENVVTRYPEYMFVVLEALYTDGALCIVSQVAVYCNWWCSVLWDVAAAGHHSALAFAASASCLCPLHVGLMHVVDGREVLQERAIWTYKVGDIPYW